MYIQGMLKIVECSVGIDITDLPDLEKFCSCSILVFLAELVDDERNEIENELLY